MYAKAGEMWIYFQIVVCITSSSLYWKGFVESNKVYPKLGKIVSYAQLQWLNRAMSDLRSVEYITSSCTNVRNYMFKKNLMDLTDKLKLNCLQCIM